MAVGDPRDEFRPRDSERDQNRREQDRLDEMRRNQERRDRERDEMERREQQETIQRLADVVNDQSIIVDKEMMKAINDPMMVMTSNGEVAKVTRRIPRTRTGRDVIRGSTQFAIQGFDLPSSKKKRKGKKNPKLAMAFKEANRRYRLKNGKLRKGRTQADIARLAQRLRKKM